LIGATLSATLQLCRLVPAAARANKLAKISPKGDNNDLRRWMGSEANHGELRPMRSALYRDGQPL